MDIYIELLRLMFCCKSEKELINDIYHGSLPKDYKETIDFVVLISKEKLRERELIAFDMRFPFGTDKEPASYNKIASTLNVCVTRARTVVQNAVNIIKEGNISLIKNGIEKQKEKYKDDEFKLHCKLKFIDENIDAISEYLRKVSLVELKDKGVPGLAINIFRLNGIENLYQIAKLTDAEITSDGICVLKGIGKKNIGNIGLQKIIKVENIYLAIFGIDRDLLLIYLKAKMLSAVFD